MKLGNGIRSILRNGAYLAGSNWIEIILRAVYVVVITRALGAEVYGVWAYVIAAYLMVVGLANFGFEGLVQIAFGRDPETARKTVQAALTTRAIVGVLAALAFLLFVFLTEPPGHIRIAAVLAFPALFARSLTNLIRAVFVALEKSGVYVRFSAAIRSAEVVAGTAILLAGGSIWHVLVLHSVTWLLEAGYGIVVIRRKYDLGFGVPSVQAAIPLFRKGTFLGLAEALTAWLTAGPLILLKASEISLMTLGQIALVFQVVGMLLASTYPFLIAAFPTLSRSEAAGDTRVSYFGGAVAGVSIALCGSAALGLYLFGEPLTVWALGQDYRLAGQYLGPAMAVAALILLPFGALQVVFVRGHSWPAAASAAIGGVVLFAVFGFCIDRYDAFGAIVAAAFAWGARAVAAFAFAVILAAKEQVSAK